MNTRIILSIIIIALGATAAILPDRQNDSGMLTEHEVLREMLLDANYLSVDELAHLLISEDPSIQLIDVRSATDFKEPIGGAVNVPFDSIFNENYAYLFDQDVMKNVFYGYDDRIATQLWMITTQLGYSNNYLLKGGINEWKATILNPVYPESTASEEAFDLYRRRSAAHQYFTGAKAQPPADLFKPLLPIQGRKKKKVEGGCS